MNIFLTGDIQVGKSTIIKRVIEKLNVNAGGFKTVPGNYLEDGSSDIFILGYGQPLKNCCSDNRVAHRYGKCYPRGFAAYPEIFDQVGCKQLQINNCQLLIMDELGFMESKAFKFQNAVLKCLDGNIPVLGVIKPIDTPFLNSVRSHEKTTVLTVDASNREKIYEKVFSMVSRLFF